MSMDMPKDMFVDMVKKDMGRDVSPDLDMGKPDVGVDMPVGNGFGAISGECDVLDDELTDNMGSMIINTLDFKDDAYDDGDLMRLTVGGQKIITDGNAGGSSVLSEVFAFEMLQRCEQAVLLKSETEIKYKMEMGGKITDLLVQIDTKKIGVSVTRAVKFPRTNETMYSVEQAKTLLDKKLQGVIDSSINVTDEDKWSKQILHILAYDEQHVESLRAAYLMIDMAKRADTIVVVTRTDGMDAPIY